MNLVGNNEFIFAIKDFKGLISANYMYITDPPLLADIGTIHFENYNLSFMLNGTTDFEDGLIYFDLTNISMWLEPFVLHFDGISDTSDVISRFLTFGGNVIGDRLSSMSFYDPAISKFNNLVNTIVGMIPDEIDIPGTNLYIEGGFDDKFKIKKDSFIELPFDLSLQNRDFPYLKNNTAKFGDYAQTDYQVQTILSDYLLESAVWSMFHDGYLHLDNLSIPISTTVLDVGLLGQLSRNGFGEGNPCVIDLNFIG